MSKQSENYRKHYDWVKKQINLLYPPGGSPSQIVEIAKKRRQEQANLGFEFMKDAPGKHKIRIIIDDGNRIDWDYVPTEGGRGNTSRIIPKSPDTGILIEKSAHVVVFTDIAHRLENLDSKRKSKFTIDDYFEFVTIKNQLLAFPMNIYYAKIERGLNRDNLFDSVVSLVRKKLELLKRIENAQYRINKKSPEIILNITRLNNIQIDQPILLPSIKNKKLAIILEEHFKLGEVFPIRNALRRLLKIK